jgi:Protein of unknown function (DUF4242)
VVEEVPSYVAECFWPGVRESDLHALDLRALAQAASSCRAGEDVRYLGSILLRDDEVVLCRFQGTEAAVRRAAVEAEIPFERILEAAQSPWPLH